MPESRSDKHGMLLNELRQKGVVSEAPESYSPKSWLRAANHCASEGQGFEVIGKPEDAFVAYLRALGCFEAFTKHREYAEIKSQGSKHPTWQEATAFQAQRQSIIDKAKSLTDALKDRDIEKRSNGSSTVEPKSMAVPLKSAKPLPLQPESHSTDSEPQLKTALSPIPHPHPQTPISHQPQTALSAESFRTAISSASDPDIAGGGSIAARLAALRTAGMQTNAKVGGASTVDRPEGTRSVDNPPPSAGLQSAGTGSSVGNGNGNGMAGRRGSTASLSHGIAGIRLETNETGSSIQSGRSGKMEDENNKLGAHYGAAYTAYRERHGSGPPTPILTPNPSGTVSQSETAPTSAFSQDSFSSPGMSPGSSVRALPSVPNHYHKSSLPNLSTSSTSSSSINPAASRSRHGTLSSGQNVPPSIQEDELAHFSSAFPALPEFETDNGFGSSSSAQSSGVAGSPTSSGPAPPPPLNGRTANLRNGGRAPRSPLAETDGFNFPQMPSPPQHRPGQPANPSGETGGHRPREDKSPRFGPGSALPEVDGEGNVGSSKQWAISAPKDGLSGALEGRFQLNPNLYGRPTPSKASSQAAEVENPVKVKPKPALPFGNSITAARLRDYLQNTSLEILIIDARPREEYEKGWVGRDMGGGDGRDAVTIWIDPTVLSRAGMTSGKLEDTLALSPPTELKAFTARAQADLVVLYDEASTAYPPNNSTTQSPPAALFSILYEKEFSKPLKRAPVLLVGGYRAWKAETDKDAAKGSRPPIPQKKPHMLPSSEVDKESRASRRETQVYRAAPAPSSAAPYSRNITENFGAPAPQSMAGPSPYHGGRPLSQSASAGSSGYTSRYNAPTNGGPTPPPAASISPGRVTRKSSDYAEHHTQPYAGYSAHVPRATMDYGSGHPGAPQPPPPAVAPSTARYENRPAVPRRSSTVTFDNLTRLPAGQDMLYWSEVALGISGLKNLGNTCYMNSTLQCLSATYPLARFFRDGSFRRAINTTNPMGTKGDLARAFSTLITMLWEESFTFLSPVTFRKSISQFAPQFAGTDQHDSQEFLSFLLDGLHEDLSRVHTRPPPVEMTPEREAALETLPPAIAAEKEWRIYKQRNDSLIVDLFQGQYRNRMECMTCHQATSLQTSTTYDSFMYLSLPVPRGKDAVVLQQLIDEFVKIETLSGEDAWNCPRCQVPRKATKSLSIARLPPVLLVHLKRFSTKDGHFWDKSETPVIFPVKNLDMTHYLPPSRGPNIGPGDDPMSQNGPFRFDLFAVSNHMGSLSNGHYTAFVNSSTGWQYCDDSKITLSSERDVITKPAYILFYKRVIN